MPEMIYVDKGQIVRSQVVQKFAPWGLAQISHRPKLGYDDDGVDV
jgi:cerevisin